MDGVLRLHLGSADIAIAPSRGVAHRIDPTDTSGLVSARYGSCCLCVYQSDFLSLCARSALLCLFCLFCLCVLHRKLTTLLRAHGCGALWESAHRCVLVKQHLQHFLTVYLDSGICVSTLPVMCT